MHRRLVEDSWRAWRKHMGPVRKHPYLREGPPRPAPTREEKRRAVKLVTTMLALCSLVPSPRSHSR